jgi:FkbM family methyltransferase
MSHLTAILALLQVHPAGPRNALRLYAAYLLAPIVKILAPRHFRTVGNLIPGKTELTITTRGIRAKIRPHTSDLDVFALVLEPNTISWFKPEKGETVLDIGAHIGRYTLTAARQGSKVVAVEPEPSNYELLRENIALNRFSKVTALQQALSIDERTHQFYIARPGDTATSSLEPEWRKQIPGPRKIVRVQSQTLDQFTDSLGLGTVDWLKIDVEGHEASVLQSGHATLARTNRLIIEVAKGNEAACRELTARAGLSLTAVEGQIGTQVSSWFLGRNPSIIPTSESNVSRQVATVKGGSA